MQAKTPELLAPAGSLTMLETAFSFGATAVYAGQPRYSLRVRNNDFGELATLQQGIARAHGLGHRFYLVSNIYPHDNKLKSYVANMSPVIALKPDAMIMSDPGLIMMAREAWPEMEIHLSVQANTVNSAAVKFWKSAGIARVILSRELSLDQVAHIRQECPDTELEVFVHGALCIAYSGRCLLSGYFNHRDANQGSCTNSCRWDYKTQAGVEDASGDILTPQAAREREHPQGVYLLEESQRPGSFMPIEEDEHGTYVMNSRDLRAIEHVQRLVAMGIDSLKIEGRTKSPYYVARTAQAYRKAIDDAVAGRALDPALLGQLEGLANRGYTSGFFQRHTPEATQNYLRGYSESGRSLYVGDAVAFDAARGLVQVNARNKFSVGDRLEISHPSGNFDVQVTRLENADGEAVQVASGSGHTVWLDLPERCVGAFVARYLHAEEAAVAVPVAELMRIDTTRAMDIRIDDLRGAATTALLEAHRQNMFEHSPPESVHALDLDGLRQPEITFWSAWEGGVLLGCGALKELNAEQAELKSMRTADGHLRKGVAAKILEHIIAVARSRHYTQLYLETGPGAAFAAARALYDRFGFRACGPFADYVEDPYSVFMVLALQPA